MANPRGYVQVFWNRDCCRNSALDILDIGAGNGWLSNRLAQKGHRPVAVDIFTDGLDGLGAARHYGMSFPLVEAEFDRLPFVGPAIRLGHVQLLAPLLHRLPANAGGGVALPAAGRGRS